MRLKTLRRHSAPQTYRTCAAVAAGGIEAAALAAATEAAAVVSMATRTAAAVAKAVPPR
eukprot:CAMPEP_0175292928 /NCGR_PEP_ID=MMETSP0093-20121207/57201_1 /TAXON_ID=311494 /ORGANISM="Alexandrium monilatum, Strain CCMP3105" /LENGTH=58 /DNA_ID=CAMNT_0016588779 /DNA_START=65 /DNA_END=238 /DNA_ORIENTATION=+